MRWEGQGFTGYHGCVLEVVVELGEERFTRDGAERRAGYDKSGGSGAGLGHGEGCRGGTR